MDTSDQSSDILARAGNNGGLFRRGEHNVLYMGLPAYHPFALQQGFDPIHVDEGVQQDTREMISAGYNVYIMWAGPEVSMDAIAAKMRSISVEWHVIGLGIGVRASTIPAVVHYFEDLLELFHKEAPTARQVFNTGPGSCLSSVRYRLPLISEPPNSPGKLLGYDFIFDGNTGLPFQMDPERGSIGKSK